jgi:hypothetical protein
MPAFFGGASQSLKPGIPLDVLIVVRLNKQGGTLGSKPCADCQKFLEKCMRDYGLRKVLYS